MNIAFIIGCARSGTSIVGELLGAHEDVLYVFEAHNVWEIAPPPPDGSHRLLSKDATPTIRGAIRKVFTELLARSSKKIIVEKCPRNALRVPYVRTIFPEAKLIHVIRDGKDVTCSLRPGLSSGWKHLKPPKWQELADEPLLVRCAKTWRDVVTITLDDLRHTPHFQLKYEDLVKQPAEMSRRLRDYLNLPGCISMAAFEKNVQDSTSNSYHAKFQSMWYRPNHSRRIGRWRENLSPAEQALVNRILGPTLRRLGYT